MNIWIRQIHRWLSIAFTATVLANFAAMGLGELPAFVLYAPLFPLFLLLFSALYMFVLPYAAKWRAGRHWRPGTDDGHGRQNPLRAL